MTLIKSCHGRLQREAVERKGRHSRGGAGRNLFADDLSDGGDLSYASDIFDERDLLSPSASSNVGGSLHRKRSSHLGRLDENSELGSAAVLSPSSSTSSSATATGARPITRRSISRELLHPLNPSEDDQHLRVRPVARRSVSRELLGEGNIE